MSDMFPPEGLCYHFTSPMPVNAFRFIQRPEYVVPDTRFVFREGRTKGIGIVMETEHEFKETTEALLARTAAAAAAAAAAAKLKLGETAAMEGPL